MVPDLQEGAVVPVELVQGVPAAPAVKESWAEKLKKMRERLRDCVSYRFLVWCR